MTDTTPIAAENGPDDRAGIVRRTRKQALGLKRDIALIRQLADHAFDCVEEYDAQDVLPLRPEEAVDLLLVAKKTLMRAALRIDPPPAEAEIPPGEPGGDDRPPRDEFAYTPKTAAEIEADGHAAKKALQADVAAAASRRPPAHRWGREWQESD